MSLAVAIQMDPIETIDIGGDSTFAMALEAQARGHRLWHYLPRALTLRDGRLTARARPLTVQAVRGNHHAFGEWEVLDLGTVDVILMRQDPPFDMAYITATHLLEHVADRVLVVNDPKEVRNAPEKLLVTHYPELMPPTLITADREEIRAFRREHGDIIVKPLFGNGGAGVFRIRPDDENLVALLEVYERMYREPIMIQRYLPEIRQGDKRIILVEGEPVGAVSRMPAEGEARANLHVGGRAQKTTLTEREREICARIGPDLRATGQIFVGIDVIGDYLTEINVTSPTGIHEINRLDGVKIEATLWDAIEARRAAMKG
ncbi:glutathione synthase [Inquilinus limosus]|uniref:glutathione synthase n=1 Tax=Inquilinus limosus TaxID=171674 RepID=UPI000412D5EF|nr:glutathione synthase [Inquilinus limosus]